MGILDSAELELPCPGCGHMHLKTIKWLNAHKQMICGACRKPATLDTEVLGRELEKLESTVANLTNRMSKNLALKFYLCSQSLSPAREKT